VYYGQGKYSEALAEFQKAMNAKEDAVPEAEGLIGIALARTGDRQKAEEILRRLKTANTNPKTLVPLYGELGQYDEAFAILDKQIDQRDTFLLGIERNPMYGSLRRDPRFEELVKKIGLPS
jgi:tetratricopeptide (TPR) repeat protein